MAWTEKQIEEMGKKAARNLPAFCPEDSRKIEVRVAQHFEGDTLILISNRCGQQANFERPAR
jgi:hypothetical protein